jgi:membrane-associated protease RseP (regulator of RpoE activity)
MLFLLVFAALMPRVVAQEARPIIIDGKFDTSTDHVLIPVQIGGHQFWCNPDSGYSALVSLDRAKAMAAGLSIGPGVPTPDGNPPGAGDSSASADVIVGGVTVTASPVIVRRFPPEAPDMDCIFGVALLRQFVVEFDHMRPRLTLHRRSTYQPPPGAARVPLLFRSNPRVPYIDVQLTLSDGVPRSIRVIPDTGTSFYGALLVGDAAAQAKTQTRTVLAVVFPDPNTPDRVLQLDAARASALTIGPFTVNETVLALLGGRLGADGSLADGTLGSGVLRRFTVAFDFDGAAMYMAPNERLQQPHGFDGLGVGWARGADGLDTVFTVLVGSPGETAGIRVGDVLTQIDGQPVSRLTPVERNRLLSGDGSERTLLLERDGVTLTVPVVLRPRI